MGIDYKSFFKEGNGEELPGDPFWGNAGAGALFLAMDTGRLLLFLRSRQVNEARTWNLVGGKLDYNEDVKEAVAREVKEETGYDGEYRMILIHTFRYGNFRYDNFLVLVPHEFSPQLNWEHDDFEWIDYGKWPSPLHFGLADVIKHKGSTITRIIQATKKKQSDIKEDMEWLPRKSCLKEVADDGVILGAIDRSGSNMQPAYSDDQLANHPPHMKESDVRWRYYPELQQLDWQGKPTSEEHEGTKEFLAQRGLIVHRVHYLAGSIKKKKFDI